MDVGAKVVLKLSLYSRSSKKSGRPEKLLRHGSGGKPSIKSFERREGRWKVSTMSGVLFSCCKLNSTYCRRTYPPAV